ncbi:MAG: DUF6247 family protein [Anaerolineae bacterium]
MAIETKKPATQILIEIPSYSLPSDFAWLERLDDEDRTEFLGDVLAAMTEAGKTQDWSVVADVVKDWQAIATSPDMTAARYRHRLKRMRGKVRQSGYAKSIEEIVQDCRRAREEVWEEEYRERYAHLAGQQ